ncbi:hypothetical protein C8D89_11765 [Actinomycetospora cinnamomea]|uniref:Uncharacterized protein n=1 Tax=Actinomycetospora cinnamomea TaxID=663609 RepID=A0A2U1EXG3_9PSEU|nr:hypothetical protein C8D89_11765 [Actinomycetospora cinnamomea]
MGVHDPEATAPYAARPVDAALEDAFGVERPLVVVAGERLAGTSRAVHRALRRMLGDRLLVPITEPHAADLADVLRRARTVADRSGPVVVLADDAPPALLDQVGAEVVEGLGTRVRLVLTTRRVFLDAHLAAPTRALLESALVEVPTDDDGPIGERVRPVDRARAVLEPDGRPSPALAVLRTVVDWERLGVGLPLTPRLLVDLAAVHLDGPGARRPRRRALRRATRHLLRPHQGGLRVLRVARRAGGEHLVADRLFSHLADRDPAGWTVSEGFAGALWHHLAPAERARVARVALARGDDQVALWLATQVPPDDLEPEALYRLGVALAARSAAHTPEPGRWDGGALRWLAAALDRADPDLVRRAHRQILLLEARRELREHRATLPHARTPGDDRDTPSPHGAAAP